MNKEMYIKSHKLLSFRKKERTWKVKKELKKRENYIFVEIEMKWKN